MDGYLKEININLEIIAKQLCKMNDERYTDEKSWIETMEMKEMEENMKVKNVLKKLMGNLKEKPNEKLISGYKQAMKDYKETDDIKCKCAADLIKKEIDRRKLEVE